MQQSYTVATEGLCCNRVTLLQRRDSVAIEGRRCNNGALLQQKDTITTEKQKDTVATKGHCYNRVTLLQQRNNVVRERHCKKVKVKSSMARSLPVENLLPQNVGSIINYLE